ncbi:hypothetical protein Ais01nite_39210 [Asanoa ishikariensis]|uniref:Uncharacterized protein n=1 Tax=Asanoa ishikariensis TaxID=137265 RepID=A0A1H3M3E1_9ACTN|nr:hypothetical protein [Asanoa ishikariensis]GIF65886.1 hypothetical protein Ais01nite_39210 [Asanoa ishikariensis]SDY71220.1 hypothetical protein SAMN05421684_1162 [Asanoa ishikariensis]
MKAHRTDAVSLIFAVIFLAIVGWWVFAQVVNVNVPAAGWWVAFGLILLGLLGLVGAVRSARNANAAQRSAVPVSPGTDASPSIDPEPALTADLGDPVSAPPRGQNHD